MSHSFLKSIAGMTKTREKLAEFPYGGKNLRKVSRGIRGSPGVMDQ